MFISRRSIICKRFLLCVCVFRWNMYFSPALTISMEFIQKSLVFFVCVYLCIYLSFLDYFNSYLFLFFYESLLTRSSLINSLCLCLLFLLILLSHTLFRGLLFTYFIPLYFSAYVWFNSEVYLGTKIVLWKYLWVRGKVPL